MSKKEKLIKRLKTIPNDFTFEEATALLKSYGYELYTKGKTSGSRVLFYRSNDKRKIMLHKPHPKSIMKEYSVRDLLETLIFNGDIEEDENHE